MDKLSQSFGMGDGDIAHNFRYRRGKNMRQNGVVERRFLNEYVVCDKELLAKCQSNKRIDYAREKIKEILAPVMTERISEYNERQMRGRHSNRLIKNLDEWLDKKEIVRGGKVRKLFSEYIFTVGDKFTACPYEYETKRGFPVDKDGEIIFPWMTNRNTVYKNGKITEAEICKKAKRIYRNLIKEFEKHNPCARIIAAAIHCDEGGACHLHMDVLWISKSNDILGIGLGETSGMRQQFLERGINPPNTRKKNAMTMWEAETRDLFQRVCLENGIDREYMDNNEKHKATPLFQKYNDKRAQDFYDALKACEENVKAREAELDSREKDLRQREAELKEKIDFLDKYVSGIDKKEAELDFVLRNCSPKKYLYNHYSRLKENPEMYETIHGIVLDDFRKAFHNKGKISAKTELIK